MNYPQELKYTKEHEWIKVDGETATVGITEYAQDQLGDIVYMELPQSGVDLKRGEVFGVVESTKAVSDLYAPVSGQVLESNTALLDAPEKVNEDPYAEAWMIKLKITHAEELEQLLDAAAYQKYVEEDS